MTAKSVLMRPQGLRPGARVPPCSPPPFCYATAARSKIWAQTCYIVASW